MEFSNKQISYSGKYPVNVIKKSIHKVVQSGINLKTEVKYKRLIDNHIHILPDSLLDEQKVIFEINKINQEQYNKKLLEFQY